MTQLPLTTKPAAMKTCSECPWRNSNPWHDCQMGPGIEDDNPECRSRKAFRVVRDAYRELKAIQRVDELTVDHLKEEIRDAENGWVESLSDILQVKKYLSERDSIQSELARVKDQVLRISQIYNAWGNGDEPEGAPSKKRTLLAIGEILGKPF